MFALAPGVNLNDRFTLRRPLGTGGMAEVWQADDEVLGRPVAVKALTASLAADPAFRDATFTEARAAARLTHPNVTQIHDYGQTTLPDGSVLPYLVMELVDGQNLADRLRSGPLPWQQAATIASQVASALAAAHRLGIVHHDTKPGNVMLTATGAKVLDFGIAAWAGSNGGKLAGTPAYAAPERLRNEPATTASDVYALGALLYEMLTGHQPVAVGDWHQAAAFHDSGTPIPPPDVSGLPRQIRRLCMACLAADPAQRPTAEQLAFDLGATGGQQSTADTAGDPSPTLVTPGGIGFAVGSARLPHPPTMIDAGNSMPTGPESRRPSRWLFGYIAAAVVLVSVIAVAIASSLSSGATGQAAPPATSPAVSATGTSPSPSATEPTTGSTATSLQAVVDQLNATIDSALAAGTIDRDTAKSLREKVKDLSQSRKGNGNGRGEQSKIADKAREVQQLINELAAHGKLDQQTASQLSSIVAPLIGQD